ncbi:sodium:solute symporter family protein [Oceanobacillus halotolerans]|uniref:sodium:solute symporter family protein n=1 Tax=Oceanobacillus halotolerans TaxID=2663380 RepID=UPI0013DCF6E8|nr:sodium:solute symporter family protein [Oceanobacillus halotolerans]
MSITTLVYLVLFISVFVYLTICYLGYKKTNQGSVDDFYLAGRSLGGFVLFLTVGASWFSMWFLLGATGSFFTHGVGFNSFFILNIVLAMFMFIFGRRLWVLGKIYGYVTPGDLLGHYYDSKMTRLISSIIGVYLLFPYIGIQLLGAGVAFEVMGSPFWLGIVTMLILVTIYSVAGGLKAVAWTDAVQGLFYMLLSWGLAFWLLGNGVTGIGSLKDLFIGVQSELPEFLSYPGPSGYFTAANWFAYIVIYVMAGICFPHLWTRYYMAKDIKSFKTVSIGHIFFASWGFIPIIIVAMLGRLFLPEIANPDQVFPTLVLEYSPILAAIFVAAAFGAAMSTVDSQMFALGTIFTRDVWKSFIKPDESENRLVWVGRIATLILMAISVIWTFVAEGSIVALSMISFTCAAILFTPMFGAMFYPKAGKYAANVSMAVGFAILLLTSYVYPDPLGVYGGAYALLGQWILFFTIAQFEQNQNRERRDKYQRILKIALNEKGEEDSHKAIS